MKNQNLSTFLYDLKLWGSSVSSHDFSTWPSNPVGEKTKDTYSKIKHTLIFKLQAS